MKWIVLALVLGLLLWLAWRCRRNRTLSRTQLSEVRARCETTPPEDTILVVLRCADDEDCGWSIFSLLESAHCPLRVFVSVLEEGSGRAAEPALAQFQKVAVRSSLGRRLADHLRTGGLRAYGGERYVMHLDSRMLVVPSWDRLLVAEQQRRPQAVLAQFPTPIEYQFSHVGVQNRTILRSQRLKNETPLGGAVLPCFPSVNSHVALGQVPGLRVRPCAGRPQRPAPALFWSSYLSFGPAAALRGVEPPPPFGSCPREHDLVVGAQLVNQGWELALPSLSIVQTLDDLSAEYVPRSPGRVSAYGSWFAPHTPYAKYVGLENGFVRVRGWMGLSPAMNDEEVLAKYGSFASYLHLRKSMTGEAEVAPGAAAGNNVAI